LALDRSTRPIHERVESNALCVAISNDGETTAVGTRDGDVHLLSSPITILSKQIKTLKYWSRFTINNHIGAKRTTISRLPIPQHLISYLLYKDIQQKTTY
jgi:hypothetical protein